MRIALDARLADVSPGGIAVYSLQLARAFAAAAPAEQIAVLRSARPRAKAEAVSGLPTVRIFTPPHHRWEQAALPLELLRLRLDLLHSPDFIPPLRRPFRSVITVHDLGFLHFPETLTAESRAYYGNIYRAVRSADRIIAVSQATRTDLLELTAADPERVEVVLEAADPAFGPVEGAAEVVKSRWGLGAVRPYVLFVGSFEPRKNLVRLLEAFAEVRRSADVDLALVGRRGWLYEPIFQRLAELGLEPYVRVVEDVRHADLPAVYSAAAVLTLPSLYEGFGLPPLEAMACGCPVVVSNRASLPEVVGEAGLLVPPDDTNGLASALLRVITDLPLRSRLVRLGLERASGFSWERAANETLAVYRRAAA